MKAALASMVEPASEQRLPAADEPAPEPVGLLERGIEDVCLGECTADPCVRMITRQTRGDRLTWEKLLDVPPFPGMLR